jgi:hypothetical protein
MGAGGVVSQAYKAGQRDGADWELDGFKSVSAAVKSSGWDDATINAMGARACAKAWGVSSDEGPEWEQACSDYERGVRDAILARVAVAS